MTGEGPPDYALVAAYSHSIRSLGGIKKRPVTIFDAGKIKGRALAYRSSAFINQRYRSEAEVAEYINARLAKLIFISPVAGVSNYSTIFNEKAKEAYTSGKTLIINPGAYYITAADWSQFPTLNVQAEPGSVIYLDSLSDALKLSSGGCYHRLKVEHFPNRAAPNLAIDVIKSGIGNSGEIDGLNLLVGSGVNGVRIGSPGGGEFTGFSLLRSQIRGGNGTGVGLEIAGHFITVGRTAVTDWDTMVLISGSEPQSPSFYHSTFEGGTTAIDFNHSGVVKGATFSGCHVERVDRAFWIRQIVKGLAMSGGFIGFDNDPMRAFLIDAETKGMMVSGVFSQGSGGDRVMFEMNHDSFPVEIGNTFENITLSSGPFDGNVYSLP